MLTKVAGLKLFSSTTSTTPATAAASALCVNGTTGGLMAGASASKPKLVLMVTDGVSQHLVVAV